MKSTQHYSSNNQATHEHSYWVSKEHIVVMLSITKKNYAYENSYCLGKLYVE